MLLDLVIHPDTDNGARSCGQHKPRQKKIVILRRYLTFETFFNFCATPEM